MELHEAVKKASGSLHASAVQLVQTPDGIDLQHVSPKLRDADTYDYIEQLAPLVSRWGGIMGEEIREATRATFDPNFNDEDKVSEMYDKVFETTGMSLCCSVFSLGYLLGDPQFDRQEHNKKTFFLATTGERDTHRALIARFSKEEFLREEYGDKLAHAATYISVVYQQLDVEHTPENVKEWGKLTASLVLFDAFQTGLRTRRIMEEESAFDQIARNLEE